MKESTLYHQVNFDLNLGMDKVVRKNYEETKKERLDRMLQWILLNSAKFHTVKSVGGPLLW